MPSAEYSPIATSELERMAKGPTAWPAWALREALTELVRRRHEAATLAGDSSEDDIHALVGNEMIAEECGRYDDPERGVS